MVNTQAGHIAATVNHKVTGYGLWEMVVRADLFVQLVMGLLVLLSVWSWTIVFNKMHRLRYLRKQAQQFDRSFWSGKSLEDLHAGMERRPSDPMSHVFSAAMKEWLTSAEERKNGTAETRMALLDRVEGIMAGSMRYEMEKLEADIGTLATVGSTAPFIGLLGTVWGIMHSFQSIAASKNTSLTVVAPGIAEALLATALGLLAAIPAVVAYNKLSGALGRYANRLETFITELRTIFSRRITRGG